MQDNKAIEVFLRIKPTKKPFQGLNVENDKKYATVNFHVPNGVDKSRKEDYKFRFNHVFGMETKQDEIYDTVASDMIVNAMEGKNGTIVIYGSRGSGKTFTMTGGVERYQDRGIIPRSLSQIFQEIRKRPETRYKVSMSYIEIYNDQGYDLLDENHTTKNLSDLNKVIPREKEDGTFILSGLSVHKAENEEQALNLLFIGDTNRVVSETPKNDASTCSHCIFIIQIESEKIGSEGKKTYSKLFLVDLAGFDKANRSGVQGSLMKEAKFSNKSLHHLEHIFICLNKKAKGENVHIPYRNSLLTMVLKESLGGNTTARVVITVSAEAEDIAEIISACKFGERAASIKYKIDKNKAKSKEVEIENKGLKGDSPLKKKRQADYPSQEMNTNEEIKRLKLLLQQRDNEIVILLNLLNKQKGSEQSQADHVVRVQADNLMLKENETQMERQSRVSPLEGSIRIDQRHTNSEVKELEKIVHSQRDSYKNISEKPQELSPSFDYVQHLKDKINQKMRENFQNEFWAESNQRHSATRDFASTDMRFKPEGATQNISSSKSFSKTIFF